eukprot:1611459-Pleurochrysis_carterae.AAC.2
MGIIAFHDSTCLRGEQAIISEGCRSIGYQKAAASEDVCKGQAQKVIEIVLDLSQACRHAKTHFEMRVFLAGAKTTAAKRGRSGSDQ